MKLQKSVAFEVPLPLFVSVKKYVIAKTNCNVWELLAVDAMRAWHVKIKTVFFLFLFFLAFRNFYAGENYEKNNYVKLQKILSPAISIGSFNFHSHRGKAKQMSGETIIDNIDDVGKHKWYKYKMELLLPKPTSYTWLAWIFYVFVLFFSLLFKRSVCCSCIWNNTAPQLLPFFLLCLSNCCKQLWWKTSLISPLSFHTLNLQNLSFASSQIQIFDFLYVLRATSPVSLFLTVWRLPSAVLFLASSIFECVFCIHAYALGKNQAVEVNELRLY